MRAARSPRQGGQGLLAGIHGQYTDEAATPMEMVLDRLGIVRSQRTQRSKKCPAHDDQRASLSVGLGRDGRVLLHCFAGCPVGDVVAALDLTMADLFSGPQPSERRWGDDHLQLF